MSSAQLLALVIEVIGHYQEMSGRPPSEIGPATCPLTDLLEFDSLNGMEVTVELRTQLGIDIPEDNLCLDKKSKPVRVEQIAERLAQLMTVR